MMRFVDVFAGLGGFHAAASQLGCKCVFACEIDASLRQIYKQNFGMDPVGDITNIRAAEVPIHDLLCAGFPCQPFSKAGGQLGLRDAVQGAMFFEVMKIIRLRRPKFVLFENVAHFLRHDGGKTYMKVKATLEELDYEVREAKLSPHQFGVPQVRERMYLVGRKGGLSGFEWPAPETEKSELSLDTILEKRPSEARRLSSRIVQYLDAWQEFLQKFPRDRKLPSFPVWSMEFGATYPYQCDSIYDLPLKSLRQCKGSFGEPLRMRFRKDIVSALPSYARYESNSFPGWKQNFIRLNRELYLENRTWLDKWLPRIRDFAPSYQKLEWNCQGESRDIWKYIIQFRPSGVRTRRPNTSPSLVAMTISQIPIIGWERRYMTARECARLQCLDELRYLPSGQSAMAALGNAVNAKVAELILKNLLKSEDKRTNGPRPKDRPTRDRMSRERRSYVMSQIRSTNTKPERIFGSLMHSAGLRYRKHAKDLPGKPDFVFRSLRIAVFVDGDFWHGWKLPEWQHKLEENYWKKKITRNRERDTKNTLALQKMGWKVIRVWEHQIHNRPHNELGRVLTAVAQRKRDQLR